MHNKIKEALKILILEDDQNDADLLERELKKSGFVYTAKIVQTRTDFEHELRTFLPDIILSDYNLPAFDGVSAFRLKHQICPDVPFIIVSGTIGEESAVELIRNGVTDYALKDKLFALMPKISRALKEGEEKKKKQIAEEEFKAQHKKLLEIAFMQTHQVRMPVTQMLNLFSMFEFDSPSSRINIEILSKLKIAAESLDLIINEIVEKTNSITNMVKQN